MSVPGILALVASCCAGFQNTTNFPEVRQDGATSLQLKDGVRQTLVLKIAVDEFVRVAAEAKHATMTVRTATGERIGGPVGATDGIADIVLIGRSVDPVYLDVEGTGDFSASIAERHAATDRDRRRLRGAEIEASVAGLDDQPAPENRTKVAAAYEEAAAIYRESGDKRAEALVNSRLGEHWSTFSEFARSRAPYERAQELFDEVPSTVWRAAILRSLATEAQNRGAAVLALQQLNQALDLETRGGNLEGRVFTLTQIADVYQDIEELDRSVEILEQALPLRREIGDPRGIAYGTAMLGNAKMLQGEDSAALEDLEQALKIFRSIGNKRQEVTALGSVAEIQADRGEIEKAISTLEDVRRIGREIARRDAEVYALNGLGHHLNVLGQYDKASEMLRPAITIAVELQSREAEASLRINLAASARGLGHFDEMRTQLNAALEVSRNSGLVRFESSALAGLGMHQFLTGNPSAGLDVSRTALDLARKHKIPGHEGRILTAMGTMEIALRRYPDAIADLREATVKSGEVGETEFQNRAYYWLAKAEMSTGAMEDALRDNTKALAGTEAARARLDQTDLRASYFVTVQDYYRQQIDLLMRLSATAAPDRKAEFAARAFEAAERARARVLLDVLGSGGSTDAGVSAALTTEEAALRTDLSKASARLAGLMGAAGKAAQRDAAEKRVAALAADYERFKTRVRSENRNYADLHFPEPRQLEELRKTVLDPRTVLVEYMLGDERSYAWLVSLTGIEAFELPARGKIEDLARRTSSADGASLKALNATIGLPFGHAGPGRRIIVVADGALHYVPFAALPSGQRNEPLVVSHEIIELPSASTLAQIRDATRARASQTKLLAILADPVYDATDPRTVTPSRSAGGSFSRLPWTRAEADSITALSPAPVFRAVDFAASRAALESADLSRYRVLHIATHSVMNEERPELSGIVLSMVDRNGNPQNGYVQSREILDLKLSADLVVLSACSTAVGKDVSGEGIMSLTRAFEYAGVPRVVASLWQASDSATAQLMKLFYAGLFQRKLRPAAALREAQLAMWRDGKYNPRDWAGFIIEGEYGAMALQ